MKNLILTFIFALLSVFTFTFTFTSCNSTDDFLPEEQEIIQQKQDNSQNNKQVIIDEYQPADILDQQEDTTKTSTGIIHITI